MKKTILIISIILLSMSTLAKTVEWSIPPIYEEIKPYTSGIFLIKKDGKWGLAKQNGEIMLPTEYDFITRPIDGVGIFGTKSFGSNNAANRIYGTIKNNKIYRVDNQLYLTEYRYFREGKLVVANSSGLRGYITDEGKQIIGCQFGSALPFSEGLAFVTKGSGSIMNIPMSRGMYITDSYDIYPEYSVLPIDWNDGDISMGSSFKNGLAVVQFGYMSAVINTKGKKKSGFKGVFTLNPIDGTLDEGDATPAPSSPELQPEIDGSFSIVRQSGLFGYDYNGECLVSPTLQDAKPFYATGYAIANNYGKYGLLHVINGNYEVTLKSNCDDDNKYAVAGAESEDVKYCLRFPESIDFKKVKFLVDDGSGNFKDMSGDAVLSNGFAQVSFQPAIDDKKNNVNLQMKVEYEDLCVLQKSNTMALEYPVVLHIDDSYTTTAKANAENDTQGIATRIRNDGDKEITITVIVKVECKGNNKGSTTKKQVIIPAKSSATVTSRATVYDPEKAVVRVTLLDRDETHSSSVLLRPAY